MSLCGGKSVKQRKKSMIRQGLYLEQITCAGVLKYRQDAQHQKREGVETSVFCVFFQVI